MPCFACNAALQSPLQCCSNLGLPCRFDLVSGGNDNRWEQMVQMVKELQVGGGGGQGASPSAGVAGREEGRSCQDAKIRDWKLECT